jgi:hypothetical protein
MNFIEYGALGMKAEKELLTLPDLKDVAGEWLVRPLNTDTNSFLAYPIDRPQAGSLGLTLRSLPSQAKEIEPTFA